MRFKHERTLWYSETEDLAAQLANKTESELLDIFDDSDIIELRTCSDKKTTIIGRLLSLVIFPLLIIISMFKWALTGDRFLDSWFKKSKLLESIREYTGLK